MENCFSAFCLLFNQTRALCERSGVFLLLVPLCILKPFDGNAILSTDDNLKDFLANQNSKNIHHAYVSCLVLKILSVS